MTATEVVQVAATILTSLGGGATIVLAASSWLGKVWASRILEADRLKYGAELERIRADLQVSQRLLQSQLDKSIHVHRIQFETEYRALLDIWSKLSGLRAAMSELRPTHDIVNPNEDAAERHGRRLQGFLGALSDFVKAVDTQSPFYPEEIFKALEQVLEVARIEETQVRVLGPDPHHPGNWEVQGRANFQQLREGADRVSSLIRDYLERLRVHQ